MAGANRYLKTPIDPNKDRVPVASLVLNDLVLTADPSLPSVKPSALLWNSQPLMSTAQAISLRV